MSDTFYFLIRGFKESHDVDVWLGIYDTLDLLHEAYDIAVKELEKEHQELIEKFGCNLSDYTISNEKIMINIYSQSTEMWKYDVSPDMVFGSVLFDNES